MDKIRLFFVFGIAAWFTVKLYGLGTWSWEQSNQAGIFLNLACVIGITTLAAYQRKNEVNFILRWKNVSKTAVMYSFFLSCSMGVWYYGIVPETIEQRKKQQLQMLQDFINDPAELSAVQRMNPAMGEQSRDAIYAKQAANIEVFFSPLFFIGTVLISWIFTAAVLSAIFAALIPRIWNGKWE